MRQLSKYLAANEKEAIEYFVEKLINEFGQDVDEVRLFGSRARGKAEPDSDLDVLILVKRPDYSLKHSILWLAAEVSLMYDILLSPCVVPPVAWQQMRQDNTLFYRTVCAEGIPLIPVPE